MIKKSIFLISLSFLLISCSSNKLKQINNIKKVSQNPIDYINKPYIFNQKNKFKILMKKHFSPWNIKKLLISKKTAQWGMMYASMNVYSSDFQKISSFWFNEQKDNSNFSQYNTLLQKSITINNSNLRVFPSNDKIFKDFLNNTSALAFDYNQASAIKINTPILISHLSKDRAWAFVKSSYTFGWIKTKDILFLNEKTIKEFKTKEYYIAIKDNFNIYKNKVFVEKIKLATIFPYIRSKTEDHFLIIVPDNNTLFGKISKINISNDYVKKAPIKFSSRNLRILTNELINESYSWGGFNNKRDCSALTRDFMAPFGIYLARNSASQKQNGKYLDMKNLSNEEKKIFIRKHAIPYLSLIYKQGHIMLYIGEFNNQNIVFHNLWSISTINNKKEKEKIIISKAIISSLEPYKTNDYENKYSLLSNVQGIINLN